MSGEDAPATPVTSSETNSETNSHTTTMRAAVLRQLGAPLEFEDRELPAPGPHQVLVRVEACGLCGIDLRIARGEWPVAPPLPRVLGHETAGRVAAVGREVAHLRDGDRVVVPRLGWACGRCEYCLSGFESRCRQRRSVGFDLDGGFATYQVAEGDFVVKVPWGVQPLDAACLSCAGATAFRAVLTAGVSPGDICAVWGVGGVGHLAVQYAHLAGADVVAVDRVEDKVTMAHEIGARDVVNASVDDPVDALQRRGGAHVGILAAPSKPALLDAVRALRPGGRLVVVAVPDAGSLELPVVDFVQSGITIAGTVGANRLDVMRALALHAAGHTRVVHQARGLAGANAAMAEVQDHRTPARLVFEMR